MPWTQQQTRYLLSDASPVNAVEKEKIKSELHSDPSMGHKAPGPEANDESRKRYARYKSSRGAS